jgi:hypothetical protein
LQYNVKAFPQMTADQINLLANKNPYISETALPKKYVNEYEINEAEVDKVAIAINLLKKIIDAIIDVM